MNNLKVGIVTCASMHEQIQECLMSLDGSFHLYPIIPSCTFSVKIDLIRHYLDRSLGENDVTLLAYGICHPELLTLLGEYGNRVVRIRGSNCYEMFLGTEEYSKYHRKCYWMLNKPFFTRWKNEILTGFGAGTNNGVALIRDTFRKLLYVRFEKDQLSLDIVEDFARTVGLECEIHSADAANLRRLLEGGLALAQPAAGLQVPEYSMSYPRESEMQTIIENIGEVIYKVDVHTKQFTFVSPQVKNILGYTQAEFLEAANDYLRSPFYHEEDRKRVVAGRYQFLVKCLNEGMQAPYEVEYRAKHKNGDDLWVMEEIYPSYSPAGIIESFVGKIADITGRKKLDQLKDEFIGLVSHELRTPLTVITGAVNTVLTEGARLSPEEKHQLLQDAALETDSLTHLLGNLLELSRVQANRLLLHAEAVSVTRVIQDTVEEIKRQSSAHQFILDLPKTLPTVYADQLRLERILYNLLDNAVKYSPQGGEVRVFVKPREEHLVIGISDQGIGISLSDQAKLFGPFQRVEQSKLEGVKGLGLGLLVSRRLVEAHGGRIWLESEPGRGSTFFFTLPLSRR
jgi:PAS domain S-box-containing protein